MSEEPATLDLDYLCLRARQLHCVSSITICE